MTLRALLLSGVLAWPVSAAAAPETIVELTDPPGDADGAGGLLMPTDSELSADDFDLLKFTVRVDGEEAIFEVTVGAMVKPPSIPQRTNATLLQLTNGIYVQNIDIYLDTDPTPGRGHGVCIPGRRVAFADGRTWERAVVLTPQPASARSVVKASFGDFASDVIFPGPLQVQGRKIIARVPISRLGGRPRADWGYSVQLSGAAWERNFNLLDVVKGSAQADALTLPVLTTGDRWAFGGGDGTKTQPQVVDLILPPGRSQREVLSSADDATGKLAEVPFVYVEAPRDPDAVALAEAAAAAVPPPPLPTPAAPDGPVVSDVMDEVVTITGATASVPAMAIGQVLGPDGQVLARVVVVQTVKNGVVASVLDHKEHITRGARVRFQDRAAPPPVAP
jgi:C-terminal binding-module, SLH-like, of glucodextranase